MNITGSNAFLLCYSIIKMRYFQYLGTQKELKPASVRRIDASLGTQKELIPASLQKRTEKKISHRTFSTG